MLHKSTDAAEATKQHEHITLKAVVTTTDQGVFKAVISTESVDREKDVVSADAMVAALRKWNRPIPLAWNHGTKAEDIFGAVDPQSVENVKGEVVAQGQVDLESTAGPDAWRSFKNRTIGFSFGYLILTATKRAGGGRAITELDVFEITATPTPMNNDTRVLSTKATDGAPEDTDEKDTELQEVKTRLEKLEKALEDLTKKADETDKQPAKAGAVDPLRKQADALALEVASGGTDLLPTSRTPEPAPAREPELELKDLRDRTRDVMLQVLSGVDT